MEPQHRQQPIPMELRYTTRPPSETTTKTGCLRTGPTGEAHTYHPTAAANRPSPNALSDEQLTWEQFMDANHLLCRWLIPAGWTEGYAKVLTPSSGRSRTTRTKGIAEGKENLLLYQTRACKAWHDALKADHFFNLAKLNDKS
jgi:hypothetical protein